MNKTCISLLVYIASLGCTKSEIIQQSPSTTKGPIVTLPRPTVSWPSIGCVNSYQEFISKLGDNLIPIAAVELDDGTEIHTGGNIVSIFYKAVNAAVPNSLFNSDLVVTHRYWGIEQINTQSSWTLGCKFPLAGSGPFTNIRTTSGMLYINAGLVWSTPPEAHFGKRIKTLIR